MGKKKIKVATPRDSPRYRSPRLTATHTLVSIFTLPQEVLSFGKPMLFDGTDFVKSIREKTEEIAPQLPYNVDLTTSLRPNFFL